MTLNVSPQIEAKLFDVARRAGIDPSTLVEKMLNEYREAERASSTQPQFTAENDPLMARLEASIASAPTDPEAIREAEEDLNELMRNMNANRAATGERIPFPNIQ